MEVNCGFPFLGSNQFLIPFPLPPKPFLLSDTIGVTYKETVCRLFTEKVYAHDALWALFVTVTSVPCSEITILQSATSDCPGELTGELCLTLEQFVSNPFFSSQSSEIVLSMQSGRYDLSTDFLISSSTLNFSNYATLGRYSPGLSAF